MKKLNQKELAVRMGISKSYLSMLLSGQRKVTPELVERLQAIPEVHKIVNFPLWEVPSKQRVVGSNPSRDAIKFRTVSISLLAQWGNFLSNPRKYHSRNRDIQSSLSPCDGH